jgi:hypothetical protein
MLLHRGPEFGTAAKAVSRECVAILPGFAQACVKLRMLAHPVFKTHLSIDRHGSLRWDQYPGFRF